MPVICAPTLVPKYGVAAKEAQNGGGRPIFDMREVVKKAHAKGMGIISMKAAKSGFKAAGAVVEAHRNGESDAAALYREKALGVFRTAKAGYRLHGMFFKNPKGRRWLPRVWGTMDRMGAVRALTKAGWV